MMKGITKLVVGIGLVGSTLAAAAAPALAAPDAGVLTYTRLEGLVQASTWSPGFPDIYSTFNKPVKEGGLTATPSNGEAPSGSELTMPLPGSQGIIAGTGSAAGLCLAVIGSTPTWKTCSGDANRLWELVLLGDEGGYGTGPGYAIKSVSQGTYLSPDGTNTAFGLTSSTSYASIIDMTVLDERFYEQGIPVEIVSPADGDTVDAAPTFSGTGNPNAIVTLTNEAGATIGTGKVIDDGSWEIPLESGLPVGDNTVTATQIDEAIDVIISKDIVTFTVGG